MCQSSGGAYPSVFLSLRHLPRSLPPEASAQARGILRDLDCLKLPVSSVCFCPLTLARRTKRRTAATHSWRTRTLLPLQRGSAARPLPPSWIAGSATAYRSSARLSTYGPWTPMAPLLHGPASFRCCRRSTGPLPSPPGRPSSSSCRQSTPRTQPSPPAAFACTRAGRGRCSPSSCLQIFPRPRTPPPTGPGRPFSRASPRSRPRSGMTGRWPISLPGSASTGP